MNRTGMGWDRKTWDRRKKRRFEMRREIRYKIWDGERRIGSGTGWTIDISSRGASFTTNGYIPTGMVIEVSISWPVLLNGDCAVRLVGHGLVMRQIGNVTACRISRFEFRTQARSTTMKTRAAAA